MFITLEGLDFSGKSTQAKLLVEKLQSLERQDGHTCVHVLREPGGTAISEQIREILLDKASDGLTPTAEILLFSASRTQLVSEVILPALERGEIVVCDRFFDSTTAYQGYGRGLDLPTLRTILRFATGGLQPELTLYLDITAEEGLRRRAQASHEGAEWNRLDAESVEFHRRVVAGYRALIAEDPARWVVIPAAGDRETIQTQLRAAVLAHLSASNSL